MKAIGTSADQANHQYDMSDFLDALEAGNLPAVSYLKAAGLSGWPCGQLRSAGRTDVSGQHHQCDRAVALLEQHGDHHRL